ncbi:MAG: class I adenylate-forming enzyme family protein [Candidatus Omnitrophica bacterium]|nr:class I adenylate-forming enzyme family protein [Candidatus Omnitrophota bacterium]MDD5553047.1 class I adenylate-forming enzyme family protein [Candidatus Omnitrophota bacterium]
MHIAEILEARAKEFPDKAAVIAGEQNVTFKQLREYSFCLANGLKKLGVKKGDKVAIYLPSWPEYIYSYLAVWCCGATCVPLDFMLTQDELISCISHCEAKVLIAKHKAAISLPDIKKHVPSLKKIVLCRETNPEFFSFESLVAKNNDEFPANETKNTDYAIIFYTSGTTGKPKGVLINYLQLGAAPKSMTHFVDFKPQDILLCALPFSHSGGLIYLQNCISFGLTLVLMERFMPLEYLKNIQRYRVTCFWIVPSMYYALLQLKEFESHDLSSVRWMVIFGAPSSADALRRFYQYCPKAEVLNGWGLTETNAPTTVIPLGSRKIESVGKPPPWIEVKTFDTDDRETMDGQVGEIVVRGWVVTDGYYKDPETTQEALRGGWFHTGDLGRFDSEGYLHIAGRKKEMIKVAGEIAFEPEIESAIHRHPGVAEVAVIGVEDKLRGEVPRAFIVLKEGAKEEAEELRYFCRQHLAHFKIPHSFHFVKELPKNRTGKVDKERLRKGL